MANSCKAACLLNETGNNGLHNITSSAAQASFIYGRGVGAAFQLVDDVLDFEASQLELGKPILNDLKQGLATAPVLFAQQQYPDLNDMIHRKFSVPGDIEKAHEFVKKSDGLQRTKELAYEYSNQAVEAILQLEQSDARDALVRLARQITSRKM